MAALRKYPDELRQRAIRMVRDADAEPGTSRKAVCRRVGQQLGISAETLRGWVSRDEIDTGGRPCGVPEVGPGSPTSDDRWLVMIRACRCDCCT